ncbi:DUF58 domain-containing protein [Sporosarcina sp. HYO08]|uniref:DUF58 domain-containing protein n=1 Tax=Sporosarcina sp. HYO08 TaxID=1759557 RepID=UPI000796D428|nr:DUF58 domain-containing protein [Sporosarcina sp. HYO08]KXH79830.1 hypothetical protein AU377_10130 [Sporosarcina sp. HYO08]
MTHELLPNQLAKRLSSFAIVSKSKRLGAHKGTHRSRKTGSSLDFSDFREYHPGDDLRHIDWNVYARTEKPYIKQFLDEQEMRIHIVLDATKSMSVDGKWEFARQLAIALGQIGLSSGDTVSFSTRINGKKQFFRKKGIVQRAMWTKMIATLETPQTTEEFTETILKGMPKAITVLFIITDGLEELEKWTQLFRKLPGICHDTRLIFVQSDEEEHPQVEGDVKLIDIENEKEVDISISRQRIESYLNKKASHEAKMAAICNRFGIQYFHARVKEGVMETVTKKMRHAGWLR